MSRQRTAKPRKGIEGNGGCDGAHGRTAFIALGTTGGKDGRAQPRLGPAPRSVTGRGARVARLRCPVLRAGTGEYTPPAAQTPGKGGLEQEGVISIDPLPITKGARPFLPWA